jgi:chromosome segregation ATPase
VERTQLEMQLVVARVVAAGAVASETFTRAPLEAARQSARDLAISTETAAAAAATEWDSLASRLALAEAEIEKLRAAAASTEEVAERAKTAAATAEATAREAAQTAAREKATLEAKVSELESDLRWPRQTWRRQAASFPKSLTSSKWQPRMRRDFGTPTPSCRRISRVSRTIPRFWFGSAFAPCRGLT